MAHPDKKIPVAVLGATGLVGQTLLALLRDHPWFEAAELVASKHRAGQRFGDAVPDLPNELMASFGSRTLQAPGEDLASPLLLSALPAEAASRWEPHYAKQGKWVISNASAFREDPQTPLLVPEVNSETLSLLEEQPIERGGLITNPNCCVAGLVLVLKPLLDAFGLKRVGLTTLQALSGAGLNGPSAFQMLNNLLPNIDGEGEKILSETRRILETEVDMSVSVHRVPVAQGHTLSLVIDTEEDIREASVRHALDSFTGPAALEACPSAPSRPLILVDQGNRPQPRLDLHHASGMRVAVGQIRVLNKRRLALTALVHNLVRGAAGAALLNAEWVVNQKGMGGVKGKKGMEPPRAASTIRGPLAAHQNQAP